MKKAFFLLFLFSIVDLYCQKKTTVERLIINPNETKSPIAGSLLTIKRKVDTTGLSATLVSDVYRLDTISSKQNTIAGVFRSTNSAPVYNYGTTGANIVARYNGTGGGGYLYGSVTSARHEGKGDLDFIIPDSKRAVISGNQPGKVNYIRGNSDLVSINNPNIIVNHAQGMHPTIDLQNGTVKKGHILYLDLDYNTKGKVKITDEFAYIQSGNDGLPHKKGKYFFIKSKTPLPSTFAGTIETNVPIKQIEKASKKVLVSKEWVRDSFQSSIIKPHDSIIQNKWKNIPTFENLNFYKTGNTVHIQGMISKGKKETVIFNLPKAYRPKTTIIRQGFDTLKNVKIRIETNGNVYLMDDYKKWINFSGINFRIDN